MATPILKSSRDSYARPVQSAETRSTEESSPGGVPCRAGATQVEIRLGCRPRVLGIAVEGTLAAGAPPLRAVVIGDGDFASNSFPPYMANSDLALAAQCAGSPARSTAPPCEPAFPCRRMILLTAAQSRVIFHIDRHRAAADA